METPGSIPDSLTASQSQRFFGSGTNGNVESVAMPFTGASHNASWEAELMETRHSHPVPRGYIRHNASSEAELMETRSKTA